MYPLCAMVHVIYMCNLPLKQVGLTERILTVQTLHSHSSNSVGMLSASILKAVLKVD